MYPQIKFELRLDFQTQIANAKQQDSFDLNERNFRKPCEALD